jgi:transglutaminase-like putative cysteine protease
MAKEAVKDATTNWQRAVALERYVHNLMKQADYTQVFATASEVAKTHSGDCSEYAVLLAALGRSLNIPSRVVVGLVYSKPLGAFGFHMWNEMYINGTWVPMDATLGQGGIGTGHLKLGHTPLENGLADPIFFTLPKVLGKLKIQIEEGRTPH